MIAPIMNAVLSVGVVISMFSSNLAAVSKIKLFGGRFSSEKIQW